MKPVAAACFALLLRGSAVCAFSPNYGAQRCSYRTVPLKAEEAVANGSSASSTKDDKVDYATQIKHLDILLRATKDQMAQIRSLASNIKDLEVKDPHLTDIGSGPDSEALRKALAEAKAACDVYGPSSKESKLAWEEVDAAVDHHPVASTHPSYRYSASALKAHHTYDAVVDTEMLSDVMDAMETVEGLMKFVHVERERLEGDK